jgi:histidinol-phosphate phosphatase family protein
MPPAVIVAGGLGTRARSMTGEGVPKALLEVAGVPIVVRQLRLLAREGVERVVVLAGHLGERVRDVVVPEGAALGLDVGVSIEPEPRGTAGALTMVADAIGGADFLVVYGDIVFDLSLSRLVDFHRRHGALVTIVAHPNDHPETSDLLVAESDGRITAILPHRHRAPGDHRNLVAAGVYACRPDVLRHLPAAGRCDFIHDLFPALLRAGEPVYAYNTPEYLRDMGSPGRFAQAEADLASGRVAARRAGRPRPALFFDCDGVLNREPGGHGVLVPDDVELLAGAAAAVRRAHEAGWLTIGVTNKPQVAKGMVTPEGLSALLGRLETLLAREGATLDRLYACPHHPDRGFAGEVVELKVACRCRKPAPGLLEQAMRDVPVAAAQSALIGDSWRDVAAAHAAGVFAYGVRTGAGCRSMPPGVRPDAVFADVAEAVAFTLSYRELAAPVLKRLQSRAAGRRIVAICGQARSGKSLLAHALVRALADDEVRALHVRLDDWVVPLGERRPDLGVAARNRIDGYRETITRLAAGAAVSAPGYDPATRGAAAALEYAAGAADVVVVDGVLAGHASVRDLIDVLVYREIPAATQRARLAEFYRWKGLSEADADDLIASRGADEWPVVEAQRASADLVVPGGAPSA